MPTLRQVQVNNTAVEEGVNDFVVHSKHTCDECYTRPIVGKRFTSSTVKDFDLCEKCFKGYEGEEMRLEALARDKATKNSFVLKLKIDTRCGEAQIQTRRINVADLWDPSVSQLSFNKLMSIASGFESGFKFDETAKVTYIDEDGDRIDISSNEEFMDSFIQTVKKQPFRPFRITVTPQFCRNKPIAPNVVHVSAPCAGFSRPQDASIGGPYGRARRLGGGPGLGPGRCGRYRANRAAATIDGVQRTMDGLELAPAGSNSPKQNETNVDTQAAKVEKPPIEVEKPPATNLASSPFFIHARHTCDGCSKTPIIGTRYHATKMSDFDLCEACFNKYEGEDLDFKPEALDVDCRMQTKWLKKQLAKSAKAGTQGIVNLLKRLEVTTKVAVASSLEKEENEKSEDKVVDAGVSAAEDESKASNGVKEEAVAEPECKDSTVHASESDEKALETASFVPKSPKSKGHDDSFLSDAEGHGSIAEVIGRTLDICVQAMEEAMEEEMNQINSIDKIESVEKELANAAAAAVDTFSVASSMVSSVTDILKNMDDPKCSKGTVASDVHADVPSTVSGATILKSLDDKETANEEDEAHAEDASVGNDSWSVVDDGKKEDKEFAGALEMVGSFLYNSGVISAAEKGGEATNDEMETESRNELSPVVLAKWDTELKQLNELGFTDEHKNVDVLERLEASHVGCDSKDKVTVNAVVEVLLEEK